MTTTVLDLELPEEVVAMLGSPEAAKAKARELLVLDLLRNVRISQGRAARLLGITRSDILQLMAAHKIQSGPETEAEVVREAEELGRYLSARHNRGGDQ